MGSRADFSSDLDIKVDSGEQSGISFNGTVKKLGNNGDFGRKFLLGKRKRRPSGGLIAVFSCFACGGDVEWLFQ